MMKILNKFFTALITGSMLFSITSCEVTDLSPVSSIAEEDAFSNPQSIEGAVIGVYNAAQSGTYSGNVIRGYPFGAATVEQGDLRGEDMYNHQLFYEITYTNSHTPSSANNVYMWLTLYRLINRANVVMEGIEGAVENGVIDQETANGYLGELLAMRAMAHHELLLHFSRPYSDDPQSPGVPYRTVGVNTVDEIPEAEQVGRGTVGEDYSNILNDLNEAESYLEDFRPSTRFTLGAVIALKNRVKLHMQDWEGVIEEFEKIEGVYSLEPSPDAAFDESSMEMILAMQNSEISNPGVNGALASMYGDPALGGRGLVKISPVIWQEDFWPENDLRRTLLTSENTDEDNAYAGYYTLKYNEYGTFGDPTPLIRYAEVLLNTAEAYERLGEDDEAIQLLNQVRGRSVINPEDLYEADDFTGADELRQAIINERRIELLAEGKRWADIHRLSGEGFMEGIPAKAPSRGVGSLDQYDGTEELNLTHSLAYENDRFIWPIPLEEILNNETLANQQNPGY